MSDVAKVPKLRFPEFTDIWQVKKFNDVFDRVTRKNTENNQNILTISAQRGLVSQEKFFSKLVSAKDVTNYYLLHRNDYAYNKSYSNGYPMGAIKRLHEEDKGVVSTLYICFTAKEKGYEEFYDQYFESGRHNSEIEKIAQEGARNHGLLNMSVGDFFQTNLTIPSANEQHKIADFLTAVDDKIAALEKKAEKLQDYKRGVMQKIFSHKICFAQNDGSVFSDWESEKLTHVFNERLERDGYGKMLSVTISNGVVPFSSIERKDNSSENKSNYKVVRTGDIAYNTMRMWQGASGLAQEDGIVSPAYTVITPRKEQSGKYWSYRFKTKDAINLFQRWSQGLTSDTWNLKFNALRSLTFSYPSFEEQQRIADFLEAIDEKIALSKSQVEETKKFKKALLQRMFV